MKKRDLFLAALNREATEELAFGDNLWRQTADRYVEEGHLQKDENAALHFGMAWCKAGWINCVANLDHEPVIIEETDETILRLDGNGAQLRYWKEYTGTPEHVDFSVKERPAWEATIKPHLLAVDQRRIPIDAYRQARELASAHDLALLWAGVAPFEQMHPVCGHEYMLMGMALDPDWVKDMVMTYARFTIMHLEALFQEAGKPDALWFYEDMGFKERPFMSPAMYEEIVQPGHDMLFDYAHGLGLKVIVHSCGYVEPLVPGLIAAGMDCLQAMEVKAGMDLPRLAEAFGDKIAFCGGVDIREIASNDRARIDAELQRKVAPVLAHPTGYIVHSDHSIPPDVDYDSLRYFFERGRTIRSWGIR